MALHVNLSTAPQRAAVNSPASSATPATGGAAPPPAPSPTVRDSVSRIGGERRPGLDMGGPQPTHHAMLIPKERFQAEAPKSAANDNPVNYGTADEKRAGVHVDEFGWVTLPPGSRLTIPTE